MTDSVVLLTLPADGAEPGFHVCPCGDVKQVVGYIVLGDCLACGRGAEARKHLHSSLDLDANPAV